MLQTSSGLLYDVLSRYDPDHVLIGQAKHDVLRDEFDIEEAFRYPAVSRTTVG